MTNLKLLNKIDKELSYVNASREAHIHIQTIIDDNRRLLNAMHSAQTDASEQPKTQNNDS